MDLRDQHFSMPEWEVLIHKAEVGEITEALENVHREQGNETPDGVK